jgi:hypothetical protein
MPVDIFAQSIVTQQGMGHVESEFFAYPDNSHKVVIMWSQARCARVIGCYFMSSGLQN